MDLTGKQIKITGSSVTAYPAKTVVDVTLVASVADGVRQVIGSYEFTFEEMYNGPSDPALLADITEKLTLL